MVCDMRACREGMKLNTNRAIIIGHFKRKWPSTGFLAKAMLDITGHHKAINTTTNVHFYHHGRKGGKGSQTDGIQRVIRSL